MKQYYKDFYGATASITQTSDGFKVKASVAGKTILRKSYPTIRSAKCALARIGECWKLVQQQ